MSQIPLDAPPSGPESLQFRPPWLRPVKKRNRTPPAPRSPDSNDSHEGHDFLDISINATSHSSPSHSHSSHEDAFLPVATEMDMDLHHYPSISHHLPTTIRTPEMTPQMFRSDGGLSSTDLVTLLNENNFDMATIFSSPSGGGGGMDVFPTAAHGSLGGHGSGRDLGIIATP